LELESVKQKKPTMHDETKVNVNSCGGILEFLFDFYKIGLPSLMGYTAQTFSTTINTTFLEAYGTTEMVAATGYSEGFYAFSNFMLGISIAQTFVAYATQERVKGNYPLVWKMFKQGLLFQALLNSFFVFGCYAVYYVLVDNFLTFDDLTIYYIKICPIVAYVGEVSKAYGAFLLRYLQGYGYTASTGYVRFICFLIFLALNYSFYAWLFSPFASYGMSYAALWAVQNVAFIFMTFFVLPEETRDSSLSVTDNFCEMLIDFLKSPSTSRLSDTLLTILAPMTGISSAEVAAATYICSIQRIIVTCMNAFNSHPRNCFNGLVGRKDWPMLRKFLVVNGLTFLFNSMLFSAIGTVYLFVYTRMNDMTNPFFMWLDKLLFISFFANSVYSWEYFYKSIMIPMQLRFELFWIRFGIGIFAWFGLAYFLMDTMKMQVVGFFAASVLIEICVSSCLIIFIWRKDLSTIKQIAK
jgi:Na+-driven multidrug efflux pump